MNIIKSSVELIKQLKGFSGIYKQIEKAGRTCYKSEDKITEDSAEGFVSRMIQSGHGAMLEHGTVYLKWDLTKDDYSHSLYRKYLTNKYSKVVCPEEDTNCYVTTNYRVIIENKWQKDLQFLCEPTIYHKRRVTFKFILPISISREFIRHRVFSFAEQSTRYCNFSKDKFNNQITFIEPYWIDYRGDFQEGDAYENAYEVFCSACEEAESQYFRLIDNGFKPQEAREILPLCTASELIVTGFIEDWEHFIFLRDDKAAHPQAQELAREVKEILRDY